MEEEQMFRSLG